MKVVFASVESARYNSLPAVNNWTARLACFILFDFVWLAAVWGRQDWLWLTALLLLVMAGLSWRVLQPQAGTWLLLVGAGLVLEVLVLSLNVLTFAGGWLPVWLLLLWLGFPAMALVVLDWLKGRYWLAALFGGVAGPFTYLVGARLGAAELHWPEPAVTALYGLLWAGYMVLFAWLKRRQQQLEAV